VPDFKSATLTQTKLASIGQVAF